MAARTRAGRKLAQGEPVEPAPGEKVLAVGLLVGLGLVLMAAGRCLGPSGYAVGAYGLLLSLVAAAKLARALD